jgi:phosphoribosylformylglycinamidine cyclo-ligase
VFEKLQLGIDSRVAELGETVGAALLRPHRSYLRSIAPLLDRGVIKGMAHITGGGITENLPRALPDGRRFAIDRQSWVVPPVFQWLQRAGAIDDREMFRAFNMGIGLILVCAASDADAVLTSLGSSGEPAWVIGRVT